MVAFLNPFACSTLSAEPSISSVLPISASWDEMENKITIVFDGNLENSAFTYNQMKAKIGSQSKRGMALYGISGAILQLEVTVDSNSLPANTVDFTNIDDTFKDASGLPIQSFTGLAIT